MKELLVPAFDSTDGGEDVYGELYDHDEFIDGVSETVEPGHSALFMLAHDIPEDTLREPFVAKEVAA